MKKLTETANRLNLAARQGAIARSLRPTATLALLSGIAAASFSAGSARADDRFWQFQADTIFEAHFNGAFAGAPYWHGMTVPGAADTVYFGSGPGVPDPPSTNPLGISPSTVYFGAFNHHSFLSDLTTHTDAVNAKVDRVMAYNGAWTFDFGSGVGGWNPSMPDPSQGSLFVNHETTIGKYANSDASLAVRRGAMTSNGVVHIAEGPSSTGVLNVSGFGTRWDAGAWIDLGWVGNGSLQVQDGAAVTVANNLYAGIRDGSSGSLTVSGGGRYTTPALIDLGSGHESTGRTHGSMLVSGTSAGLASTVSANQLFVGGTGSGDATVSLGAHVEVQDLLRIGSLGTGTMQIWSGGTVDAHKDVVVGSSSSSGNSLTLSGNASRLNVGRNLNVGTDSSKGTVSVTTGAAVSIGSNLYAGTGSGATGDIVVNGGGSIVMPGAINLAFAQGSSGSLRLDGSGSSVSASILNVGSGGPALAMARTGANFSISSRLETWDKGVVDVYQTGRGLIGAGNAASVPAGALQIGPGGVLAGTGIIHGNVILAGGSISPGHSPGTITIGGDLSIQQGSTVAMEIGGTGAGQYDRINLLTSSSVNLDGTLQLTFIDHFAPRAGDVFNLLLLGDSTAANGAFSQIAVQNLMPGWQYSFQFDAANDVMSVTSLNDGVFAPAPGVTTLLGLSGLLAVRRQRGGRAGGGQ